MSYSTPGGPLPTPDERIQRCAHRRRRKVGLLAVGNISVTGPGGASEAFISQTAGGSGSIHPHPKNEI
jgi:hypothetical protein